MYTYFFEIRPNLLDAYKAHFKQKHQVQRPGNELSVIPNVANTSVLVKVNSEETLQEILPNGLTPYATLTLEEARVLLRTSEWNPFP